MIKLEVLSQLLLQCCSDELECLFARASVTAAQALCCPVNAESVEPEQLV